MTTITVARKGGQVAIAADSLVTFGETRLSHGYEGVAPGVEPLPSNAADA